MDFFNHKLVRTTLLILVMATGVLSIATVSLHFFSITPQQRLATTTSPDNFVPSPTSDDSSIKGQVLAASDGSLSFSTPSNNSATNGVSVLSTNTDPRISLTSYKLNGTAEFKLYQASKDDLLNYLIYQENKDSDWGSSINKKYSYNPSTPAVTTIQADLPSNETSQTVEIELPITNTGVWFLRGGMKDETIETMIVRSNLAGLVHEGDNQNIFWIQNNHYQPVDQVDITLLNLKDSQSTLSQLRTNQDGLAVDVVNTAVDIALVTKDDDFTIIPVNLSSLQYRSLETNFYSSFSPRQTSTESFMFTDRFLYQPGDTVHFKAIIREDDDGNYDIKPETFQVSLGGGETAIWNKTMTLSELGTLTGSIELPKKTEASYYSLSIRQGESYIDSTGIQVARYRKPSSSISLESDQLMYQPGDEIVVDITGKMFLGQPIRNQNLKYKVYESSSRITGDYTEVEFAQLFPDFNGSEDSISEGELSFNHAGQAQLNLQAKNITGQRRFWTIHVEYLDGSYVAATEAIRVLVNPGEFIIEEDNKQNTTNRVGRETKHSFVLNKNISQAKVSNIEVGASLYISNDDGSRTLLQDNLQGTSDQKGKFEIVFTPTQTDRHELKLETQDAKGNYIATSEYFYVSAQDIQSGSGQEDIFTIKTDKDEYAVGETAEISISSSKDIKSAFVSLGRAYSREFKVVPVTNGQATTNFKIKEPYQPNIYVQVSSFWQDYLKQQTENLMVNTDDKKISVEITPDKKVYGPGETANFELYAIDGNGDPVQTDLAFWVFDKSLLELHGMYFKGIFQRFWSQQYFYIPTHFSFQGIKSTGAEGGGGCFTGETMIKMADGTKKRIDQVKTGDLISTYKSRTGNELTSAEVNEVHEVEVPGYLIINSQLKVTPEHIILINGEWKPAGEIKKGDQLLSGSGGKIAVDSVEWVKRKASVFNLHIDKYQTFIANNIYVHNEKGDIRSSFKDTAYWNPSVLTDQNGRARISFTLPDNLTTWVGAAVAANSKTQVGEGMTELVVTKDLVVTPIIPQFLRVGDTINLAALIQNFTDQKQTLSIAGLFNDHSLSGGTTKLKIDPEGIEQAEWQVTAAEPAEEAVFQVRAESQTDQSLVDTTNFTLPVHRYGSWVTTHSEIKDDTTIPVELTQNNNTAEEKFYFYPTQFPELQNNIEKLISRSSSYNLKDAAGSLIAASIVNHYGQTAGINYQGNLNEVVSQALETISRNQSERGVWENHRQEIDYPTTRFIIESLWQAKQAGLVIDDNLFNRAIKGITDLSPNDLENNVERNYILSLTNQSSNQMEQLELDNLTNPATIARSILANPSQLKIELETLKNKASETPTQYAWHYKDNERTYWTQIGLPTAWGTLTLLESDSELEKAEKGLEYLYRNPSRDTELLATLSLATVKYYQLTNQLERDFNYQISQNGEELASGEIDSRTVKTQEFRLPKLSSGEIVITKNGSGVMRGDFELKQFYSSREMAAVEQGLSIKRSYKSTKKRGQPIDPGDLVIVELEVGGLGKGETEVEIIDYLPAGLVAIDESLRNDRFEEYPAYGEDTTRFNHQLTEQGSKISATTLLADDDTYRYKTRVVSNGEFTTPPAEVRLGKQPAIWGHSTTTTLVVDGKNSLETVDDDMGATSTENIPWEIIISSVVLILVVSVASIVFFIRRKKQKKKNATPQSPPLQQQPQQPQS